MMTPDGLLIYEQPGVGLVVSAAEHNTKWSDWQAERDRLLADKRRIDWLADKNNNIGNVTLPRIIVERNLTSLRDAIDQSMRWPVVKHKDGYFLFGEIGDPTDEQLAKWLEWANAEGHEVIQPNAPQ